MKIIANSKDFEIKDGDTVSDFIEGMGLNPMRCVVELNGRAMRYDAFAEIVLSEGDRLEVMQVVAGG